jgi:hypothetical protein
MLGAVGVGSTWGPGIPTSTPFTCTAVAVTFIFWDFLEHMKYIIIKIIRMNTKPPTHPPMIAPIGRSLPFVIRKNKSILFMTLGFQKHKFGCSS